jgi:hypothetical protein
MAKLFLALVLLLAVAVANASVLVLNMHPSMTGTECTGDILSSIVDPDGSACLGEVKAVCTETGAVQVSMNCTADCASCGGPVFNVSGCSQSPTGGIYVNAQCVASVPAPLPGFVKNAQYAEDDCEGTPTFLSFERQTCHFNQSANTSIVTSCETGAAVSLQCTGNACEGGMSQLVCVPVPAQGGFDTCESHEEGGHHAHYITSCVALQQNTTAAGTTGGSDTTGGSSTAGGSGTSGSATSGGSTGGKTTGGSTTGATGTSTTSEDVSGAAAIVASFVIVAVAAIAAL